MFVATAKLYGYTNNLIWQTRFAFSDWNQYPSVKSGKINEGFYTVRDEM